jgi:magnesium and cobalt transporter
MVTLMKESKDISWINRIKDLLADNPKDKKDLISLLETAAKDNLITQDSYQMILGVFSVSEIPVREIMIPRPHMIAIDVNDELNTVITKVIESGHSRFPVINGKLDEIIGILHAKDLLKNQINMMDDFDLHDYMRQATFIPESKRLNVLLNDFKASRNHIAIVIDEHSNVSGLVTLE